ncbi:MAG: sulfotransferase family protein [Symploca sp. SIO3C6]|nr:sulfotransferase family protein [Symploca sp. SIO3C6]
MISHKHKCIFVEVPKTGSSSIRNIIGSPPKPHLNICQIKFNMQNYWTHYGGLKNQFLSSAYLLLPKKERLKIGKKQFNSYFKFGFVRNPWDRVVSLYLRREGLQMRDKLTFDEFVSWIKYSSSTCVNSIPHVNQIDWFVDPHGNVIVDFIGRFENLQKDWTTISKQLGLKQDLPHKNKNMGRSKHYTEYYSEVTKKIIQDKFRVDIEYFGYEFEG